MQGISKSQVSRLCGEIDERVGAFLARPIEGDRRMRRSLRLARRDLVKVRRDHHIVSVAVIIAVGVNTDGRREALGMTVGHSEAEPFWIEFLRSTVPNCTAPTHSSASTARSSVAAKSSGSSRTRMPLHA